MIRSSFIVLAALVVLSGGCKSKETAGADAENMPCDAAALAEAADAIQMASRDIRAEVAGAALAEACPAAPAGLKQALEARNVSPDQRMMLVAAGVSKEPGLLMRGCAGGPRVLADLAAMAPEGRNEAFLEGCRLDPEGRIASRSEYLSASSEGLMVVMLARAYMGEQGEQGPGRSLLRNLLGL